MSNLSIIGVEGSHDTLRDVVGARNPCKILDVPAGEGIFCEFLKDRGWDVHAGDIDPGNFKLSEIPFSLVNLNKTLPFDDESFDAVSCVNGLHRLLFPEVAVREFFRILKPGGQLYINLNNYSSISKRLRFLIAGSIDEAIDTQHCIQTIDDPEAHIRLPLLYPHLKSMLERSGFQVIGIQPAAVTRRDRLLAPIAALIRYAASFVSPTRRDEQGLAAANAPAILGGGAYIFIESSKPQ